jgi:hypothetical protein
MNSVLTAHIYDHTQSDQTKQHSGPAELARVLSSLSRGFELAHCELTCGFLRLRGFRIRFHNILYNTKY